MKKLIFVLIVLFSQLSFAEPLLQQSDKQMHFAVSAAVSAASYDYYVKNGLDKEGSILLAIGTASAIGYIKEYAIDSEADTGDSQANLMGAGAGVLIMIPIHFEF